MRWRDAIPILSAPPALALATFFAAVAVGALKNLWADYQDGNDVTYLVAGVLGILGAAGLAALVALILREASTDVRILAVAGGFLLIVIGAFVLTADASAPTVTP